LGIGSGGSGGSSASLTSGGGTVTFGAGQTSAYLSLQAERDALVEGTEGFRVTVLGGSGYQAGGSGGSGGAWGAAADIRITDVSPLVSVEQTVSVGGQYSNSSGGAGTAAATSAQTLVLSASVAGLNGPITGSIVFMDGSAVLGTATLSGGFANLTAPAAWTVGTHSFTAHYGGDAFHTASVSDADTVLVSPDVYQTRQGQPLIVSAQAGLLRLDPNADPASTATSSLVEGPSHGTLTTFDDGSFVYNPNPGYLGTETFTYRAGNPLGVGTVAITVFDTAPVAAADSYTVPHGRTFALGLGQGILSNDSDADGDRLSSRLITGPAHGTLALNPYGIFSYTPNPGFIGADSFTYVAGDGAMESAPALVALNVVDTAPGGQNRSYSTSPDLPLRITTGGLLEGATDPEGDTLSAILVAGPANGRVSLARDGSFGYLANQGFTGLDHFTFRITDGALESATYTASIQIAGAAPSTVDGQFSVVHDGTLFVPFDRGLSTLATSNNPNGTLSFALSAGPSHGTVTVYARGAFTYTPDAGYTGDDSFSFTASDGYVSSGAATVVIHVTDVAPTAAAKTFAAVGGRPLLASAFDGVLSGASDADGDWITASLVSGPGHGALSLNADGSFVYTPDDGFVGTDTFSFRPFDGVQYGLAAVVSLAVGLDPDLPGAAAPTATNDTLQILHDTTLTVAASLGILANDNDPGGRPPTAQLVAGPAHGTLVLNARGSFQYVPHAGYVGSDSFTYKAHNGKAGSETATVFLAVTDAAPTAAPSSHTAPHGRTLVVPISRGVLAGASDADGDLLSAILVGSPSHGTVALAADGSFAYIPDAGYVGFDTFTFAASDGVLAGAATTVTILLTDGAPTAGATQYQINRDGVLVVAAWNGVLTAAGDPEGDAVAAVLLTGPAHGSLDLHADGSFVYTPHAGYVGSDSFSFSPTDGLLAGSPVTVGLTVVNPPRSPRTPYSCSRPTRR